MPSKFQTMNRAPTDEFVRLYAKCQQDIYRYVLSLVPNQSDASDVLQETAAALWSKFADYDAAEPFLPWARRFAYFEALRFYKERERRRDRVTALSSEAVAALAVEYERRPESGEPKRQALSGCLQKLPERDRQLVHEHYEQQDTIQNIAGRTGENIHTLYKRIGRIRRNLLECVQRKLASEAAL